MPNPIQIDKLIRDLGFKNIDDFEKHLNTSIACRATFYNFKWRLFIYKNHFTRQHNSLIKKIEKWHTEYEDYLNRLPGPNILHSWPTGFSEFREFIEKKLIGPYKIEFNQVHRYNIINPNKVMLFRALDPWQLMEAVKICYNLSRNKPVKNIVYVNGLQWGECLNAYQQRMRDSRLWVKKDLDISLAIADRIIKTFDPRTGLFQTNRNPWALEVIARLTIDKNTSFKDIHNIVSNASINSLTKSIYAIAICFGVGGSRARAVILHQYDKHNIPKWW